MDPVRLEVIHTYRRLFRAMLRAVCYSTPSRYVGRDILRAAFREPVKPATTASDAPPSSSTDTVATGHDAPSSPSPARRGRPPHPTLDRSAIQRTIWFLEGAAREAGTEHRILKSLILTAYWRQRTEAALWKKERVRVTREVGQRAVERSVSRVGKTGTRPIRGELRDGSRVVDAGRAWADLEGAGAEAEAEGVEAPEVMEGYWREMWLRIKEEEALRLKPKETWNGLVKSMWANPP